MKLYDYIQITDIEIYDSRDVVYRIWTTNSDEDRVLLVR